MPLMAVATRVAPTHGGVPITVGGRYRSCPCLRDTLNDVAVAPAAAARSAAIKAHVTLLAAVQCVTGGCVTQGQKEETHQSPPSSDATAGERPPERGGLPGEVAPVGSSEGVTTTATAGPVIATRSLTSGAAAQRRGEGRRWRRGRGDASPQKARRNGNAVQRRRGNAIRV